MEDGDWGYKDIMYYSAVQYLNGSFGVVDAKKAIKWLKAAGIRALKTAAQTAAAIIGTAVLFDEVNWAAVGSASLLAAALSLLTSLGGLPELEKKD